LETFVYIMSL